jgi:hypothetical protein
MAVESVVVPFPVRVNRRRSDHAGDTGIALNFPRRAAEPVERQVHRRQRILVLLDEIAKAGPGDGQPCTGEMLWAELQSRFKRQPEVR